jgi:hypothetical protein
MLGSGSAEKADKADKGDDSRRFVRLDRVGECKTIAITIIMKLCTCRSDGDHASFAQLEQLVQSS